MSLEINLSGRSRDAGVCWLDMITVQQNPLGAKHETVSFLAAGADCREMSFNQPDDLRRHG